MREVLIRCQAFCDTKTLLWRPALRASRPSRGSFLGCSRAHGGGLTRRKGQWRQAVVGTAERKRPRLWSCTVLFTGCNRRRKRPRTRANKKLPKSCGAGLDNTRTFPKFKLTREPCRKVQLAWNFYKTCISLWHSIASIQCVHKKTEQKFVYKKTLIKLFS